MRKLTPFEIEMLNVIATFHPYHISEVRMVYQRCKSFDTTIEILELACSHTNSLEAILSAKRF